MGHQIKEVLVYWDHVAWYYLNTQWRSAWLDVVAPFLRNPVFWVPVYFFLALFMPVKFGKKGLVWCALFLVAFALSDQVSASLMKPFFHRLRPCFNPYLKDIVHLLVPCGGHYGFPSSHASNHFAIGIFSAVTLGKIARWVWPAAISWALCVCYAQVYVGVHFPMDVLAGGLVGATIGLLTGAFFNRYFSLARHYTYPTVPPEKGSS